MKVVLVSLFVFTGALLNTTLVFASEFCFVFVHIGNELPSYAYTAIKQVRFMNQESSIHLLVDHSVAEDLQLKGSFIKENHVSVVDLSLLPITEEHKMFRKVSRFNKVWRDGFWNHGTERFFYLYDFMKINDIHNMIHVENDTMIYVDVEELSPFFQENNVQLAAPFQSMVGCPPCFVYFKDEPAYRKLIDHMLEMIRNYTGSNFDVDVQDWVTFSSFLTKFGDEYLTSFPILMPEYSQYFFKRDIPFRDTNTPLEFLSRNANLFPGYLFDAAALGIYANGHDPRNGVINSGPGVLHYKSLFDPGNFSLFWGKDKQERIVPYLVFKEKIYRLTNLHLHSKMLDNFASYERYQQPFPKESHECQGFVPDLEYRK